MRLVIVAVVFVLFCGIGTGAAEERVTAKWPLAGDGKDHSPHRLHAKPHDVEFVMDDVLGRRVASFNGRSAWLEVPADDRLRIGKQDFSISVLVRIDGTQDDVPGDIISRYDAGSRRGFHLAIKTNAGVTFSQANARQLQFGIDDNRAAATWTDCGRPGNAVLAFALCAFEGDLYAGTCEPRGDASGRVYRYGEEGTWIDCGAPDGSNAVTSLAVHDGALYAGTGKYRLRGSSLPESENETLGGRIFRYAGNARWIDCGQLPDTEAVGGLVVYRGHLYASSLYRPAGFFRYDGGTTWTDCGCPVRPDDLPGDTSHMRVEALGVFDGWLYATSYDGGRVFRFDGERWFDCGQLGENTQTYAFAVRQGDLYVGTWRSGRVYRFEEPHQWTDVGRLGDELEVMGMLVHNGRLIAGTLPLAEVYEFDGDSTWKRLTQLDDTPQVQYRRAWTMAEHGGRVFCSTLPSGHIYSWRAGRVAMSGTALTPEWHHVAAIRTGSTIALYVDGALAAREEADEIGDFDLDCEKPIRIGAGPNDFFKGRLSDVRLYGRALSAAEIRKLAEP
ncbi:MAG: LamG-like jellyroll fold domain-containing protein [Maioricimonas sp. JB049]